MGFFTRKNMNMLSGPILPKIIAFAVPLMLTNLLQTLYNAADTVIVGLSGVEGAIGAIGTTSSFCHFLVNFFIGFSVGSGVVVAKNIGAGDEDTTRKSVHTAIVVAILGGILIMCIGLLVSPAVLTLMGDEGHILELATVYTRIYFLGAPFLALTNFEISILRAKGDTVTPLAVLAFTGGLNVALNLLFVMVFSMSVDGVALATMLANAVSAIFLFIRLTRQQEESWVSVRLSELHIDKRALSDIVRNGLPAAGQGMLFSVSNMLIQSTCIGINNRLCPGGSDVIDGRAAAQSIETFLYTANNSVAQAAVTFISQNYGARQYRRIGHVMRDCYIVTAVCALCSIAIVHAFRYPLLSLYVSSPLAIETGETFIFIDIGFYVLYSWVETGSASLRGMGRAGLSMLITMLGCCVLRVFWIVFGFPHFGTFASVIASYPVTWFITAVTEFLLAVIIRRKLMNNVSLNENKKVPVC